MALNSEAQKSSSTSSNSSCGSISLTCPYKEIYFLSLGSQSNIYCTCKLPNHSSCDQRLFVASLRGKVSCIETGDQIGAYGQPQSSEVYFTYIPGDAEIISIHGFCKSKHLSPKDSCELIIGVTLILIKNQHADQGAKYFFNVYMYNLDIPVIAAFEKTTQICQHQLSYVPYHLTSTKLYDSSKKEYQNVFLLSGGDAKVHMFREIRNGQKYVEQSSEDLFPEFLNIPSSITWIDTKMCQDHLRISAYGCESGYFQCSVVDSKRCVILNTWKCNQDGPISSVKLFTLKVGEETSKESQDKSTSLHVHREAYCSANKVSLLVTSALEVAAVYLEVAACGLDKMVILPRSDSFDSVTCSHVADVDLDGRNEILIGTYGQELLAYKWQGTVGDLSSIIHFDLLWTRSFSKPLFSILDIDLLNDGLGELAVTSLAGVHVLQHDVNHVADLAIQRFVFDKNSEEERDD